jgi:hypothetical protein
MQDKRRGFSTVLHPKLLTENDKLTEFTLTLVGYLVKKLIPRIGSVAMYLEPIHFTFHCVAQGTCDSCNIDGLDLRLGQGFSHMYTIKPLYNFIGY